VDSTGNYDALLLEEGGFIGPMDAIAQWPLNMFPIAESNPFSGDRCVGVNALISSYNLNNKGGGGGGGGRRRMGKIEE